MTELQLDAFIARARSLSGIGPLSELLLPGVEAVVARAPGRLDVMGGIADYSGSLVLQMPIAEGTWVLAQRASDSRICLGSLDQKDASKSRYFEVPLAALAEGTFSTYEGARRYFKEHPEDQWAAYVLGVMLVMQHRGGHTIPCGIRILVQSEVPEGKGVSSSAALEVAVLNAVLGLLEVEVDEKERALWAHEAENRVAGAPCGVMDQMASQCGREGQLLRLLCQPATIEGYVRIPDDLAVYGIDSGVRHAVTGSDYGSVRVGAFMGYRCLLGDAMSEQNERYGGYLANVTVSEWLSALSERVPERMNGAEFLRRYGVHLDSVTDIDPEREYALRKPTAHPIYEHHRCRLFAALLGQAPSEEGLRLLGELMYQSHTSYSACGLGCAATDELVRQVREQGAESGLLGARITGGGSGGTVAVLAKKNSEYAVLEVAKRYREKTGRAPTVFRGTSHGAKVFCKVSL